MRVLEQFTLARADGILNEDSLVTTEDCVAVIDGAGDAEGRTWHDRSFGRHAADALGEVVRRLEPSITPADLVSSFSMALANQQDEMARDGYTAPWPAANMVLYLNAKRQIVRVGDCTFRIDDHAYNPPPKAFEQVVIDTRRLIMHAGLGAGLDPSEVTDDIRRVFKRLYRYQTLCQNTSTRHPYSFAVLDGSRVPDWGIEVFGVSSEAHEIVLASDGYPEIYSTLNETESALARILKTDPHLIGEFSQTKALRPGDRSFDDRTYVRFTVD